MAAAVFLLNWMHFQIVNLEQLLGILLESYSACRSSGALRFT